MPFRGFTAAQRNKVRFKTPISFYVFYFGIRFTVNTSFEPFLHKPLLDPLNCFGIDAKGLGYLFIRPSLPFTLIAVEQDTC